MSAQQRTALALLSSLLSAQRQRFQRIASMDSGKLVIFAGCTQKMAQRKQLQRKNRAAPKRSRW
jgi:hypothetical protein